MTRFALSLAFFMLATVPGVGADKFECPSPFKPNTAAKLEQINGLLPNANAMSNINQLSDTIVSLRRFAYVARPTPTFSELKKLQPSRRAVSRLVRV
jgi:hypothetical protein